MACRRDSIYRRSGTVSSSSHSLLVSCCSNLVGWRRLHVCFRHVRLHRRVSSHRCVERCSSQHRRGTISSFHLGQLILLPLGPRANDAWRRTVSLRVVSVEEWRPSRVCVHYWPRWGSCWFAYVGRIPNQSAGSHPGRGLRGLGPRRGHVVSEAE